MCLRNYICGVFILFFGIAAYILLIYQSDIAEWETGFRTETEVTLTSEFILQKRLGVDPKVPTHITMIIHSYDRRNIPQGVETSSVLQ